jgi:hypothetical protein
MASYMINGLGQAVTEASTTKYAKPGVVYEDGDGNKYNYGYFSVYCSAGFQTVGYEQADGVLKLAKGAATSTTLQNGGTTLCNTGTGYYAFTQIKGNCEAYVTSSVAAGSPLTAASAASAGVLNVKAAGIAGIIAQAVDTGQGEGTMCTVNMQIAI